MHKKVSQYLDTVCDGIKPRERQREVRGELAGHIADIIGELTKENITEDAAVSAALERMGNVKEVRTKLITANKPTGGEITIAICGIALCIATVFISMIITGSISSYIDLPSLIIVICIGIGLALAGGIKGLTFELFMCRVTTTFLYGGALGFIFGIIGMLNNLSDPSALGPSISVSLVSVLYGLLLSGIAYGARTYIRASRERMMTVIDTIKAESV